MTQTTKTTEELIEELNDLYEGEILEGVRAIEGLRGEWGVRLTPRRLQIGLVDDDKRIDRNCIEVYFGYDYLEKRDCWEAQIGNRGTFDLTPGSERLVFFQDAGLILSSDFMQELEERLNGDYMGVFKEITETK